MIDRSCRTLWFAFISRWTLLGHDWLEKCPWDSRWFTYLHHFPRQIWQTGRLQEGLYNLNKTSRNFAKVPQKSGEIFIKVELWILKSFRSPRHMMTPSPLDIVNLVNSKLSSHNDRIVNHKEFADSLFPIFFGDPTASCDCRGVTCHRSWMLAQCLCWSWRFRSRLHQNGRFWTFWKRENRSLQDVPG